MHSIESETHIWLIVNSLTANPTKWSNTLKQFVRCCRRIVAVFEHFVRLALNGLNKAKPYLFILFCIYSFQKHAYCLIV